MRKYQEKYQEPRMNLLELELEDIITTSGGLYESGDVVDGESTGGAGGNSDSMGWDEF